jgi:biotin carboxyl carrier protein
MNSVKQTSLGAGVGGGGDVRACYPASKVGPPPFAAESLTADLPWQEKRRTQQDLKGAPCRRVRSAAAQPPTWAAPPAKQSQEGSAPAVLLNVVRSSRVGRLEVDETAGRPMAHVNAGQLLATVRALGMDFRIEAPYAGTLTVWHASDGGAVGYGQLLATLKPD